MKKNTLFPDNWSDEMIIQSIKDIADYPPVGIRIVDGAITTLHNGNINGVEIDEIKEGINISAGYPVGGKPTSGFNLVN